MDSRDIVNVHDRAWARRRGSHAEYEAHDHRVGAARDGLGVRDEVIGAVDVGRHNVNERKVGLRSA